MPPKITKTIQVFPIGEFNSRYSKDRDKLMEALGQRGVRSDDNGINTEENKLVASVDCDRDDLKFYSLTYNGILIAETRIKRTDYHGYCYSFLRLEDFSCLPESLLGAKPEPDINQTTGYEALKEHAFYTMCFPEHVNAELFLFEAMRREAKQPEKRGSLVNCILSAMGEDKTSERYKSFKAKYFPIFDEQMRQQRIKEDQQEMANTFILALEAYTTRIESYRNQFDHGFWFFKQSRALNRKANYLLAKELIAEIRACPATKENIHTLFQEQHIKALRSKHIDAKNDHGLNSAELNAVFKLAHI